MFREYCIVHEGTFPLCFNNVVGMISREHIPALFGRNVTLEVSTGFYIFLYGFYTFLQVSTANLRRSKDWFNLRSISISNYVVDSTFYIFLIFRKIFVFVFHSRSIEMIPCIFQCISTLHYLVE